VADLLTVSGGADLSGPEGVAATSPYWLTARFEPVRAGRLVSLQRRTDRGWEPTASAVQNDSGGVEFRVRGLEVGSQSWRVVAQPHHGSGTTVSNRWTVAVRPTGYLPRMRSLTLGSSHTCGIDVKGRAWCWGYGREGEVGNGAAADVNVFPRQVAGGMRWKELSAGASHTCGVAADGAAWCWGSNWFGTLGDGSNLDRTEPVRVSGAGRWRSVSAGGILSCGVRDNGTLWCWGRDQTGSVPERVGARSNWTDVSAGQGYACGITTDSVAWCWGDNFSGQLGDGTTTHTEVPRRLPGRWTQIAAGENTSCGVRVNGSAWCWGDNDAGQVGDGTTTDRLAPAQVGRDTRWASVDVTAGHACGIQVDGSAWCWGGNAVGEIGSGHPPSSSALPLRLDGPQDWTDLDVGQQHTCGVRSAGTDWCWGANWSGQLGDGTLVDRTRPFRVVHDLP
jgi:alpha-tubulin suppressor-like RCC1 family protein